MSKESVSNDYTQKQLDKHALKPLNTTGSRAVLITGAYRSGSIGESILHRLESRGDQVLKFSGDVRTDYSYHPEGWEVDTLICCHGVAHLDWLEDAPPWKIKEIIDVNLTGSILMATEFVNRTLGSHFRKQIFFIGSMAHRAVLNGSAAYCASKAGLQHFVRCAAWELAPKGYDVFCINPSNTEGTPMTRETVQGIARYRSISEKEAEAYWGSVCPMGKWLLPGDIADLVAWLMEGHGQFLSGTAIDLAGAQR